jgi:hypothetical protein
MLAQYLFAVEECYPGAQGLFIKRGIPLSELSKRPEIKAIRQGVMLELRFRDGTMKTVEPVEFGVTTGQLSDGAWVMETVPRLHSVLSGNLRVIDVPPGTEV